MPDPIFVHVPDLVHLCLRAVNKATKTADAELMDAAVSVRSALMPHLNKLHYHLPAELRQHYDLVLKKGGS